MSKRKNEPIPVPESLPSRGIHVALHDYESGKREEAVITDGFIVVCHGTTYVDSRTQYANGTHVITIKTDHNPDGTPKLSEIEHKAALDAELGDL